MRREGAEERERGGRLTRDTYYDGDGGGSAQDLLHQAVSVIQRFHDLPLALGDLERREGSEQRRLVSAISGFCSHPFRRAAGLTFNNMTADLDRPNIHCKAIVHEPHGRMRERGDKEVSCTTPHTHTHKGYNTITD